MIWLIIELTKLKWLIKKLAGTAGGSVTGGANVGAGTGQVYKSTSGGLINFKTIKGSSNISVQNNTNDVTISFTGFEAGRTTFSNANYAALSTDKYIAQVGTLSTSRTVTLPLASSVLAGFELIVADESGTVTSSNTIVIQRSGSDTINLSSATDSIVTAYGQRRFFSDGVSNWSLDSSLVRKGSNYTGDVSGTFSAGLTVNKVSGNTPSTIGIQLFTGASAAQERAILGIEKRTTFSNAAYVALSSDKYIAQIGTLSASRTVTLPLASSVNPGYEMIIGDESGSVTTTNTIVIQRSGSDTINMSSSTDSILTAYGERRFFSDGVSNWSLDTSFVRRASNFTGDVSGTFFSGLTVNKFSGYTPSTLGIQLFTGSSAAQDRALLGVPQFLIAVTNKHGSTISKGQPIYFTGADQVALAKADAVSTSLVSGTVFEASIANNAAGNTQTHGIITMSDWTSVTGSASLTTGSIYYLSKTTAGQLTTTSPDPTVDFGSSVVAVGVAVSTTELRLMISYPILL